jgi:hypothetical protein
MDLALISRIHLSLEFPDLDIAKRKRIWRNLINRGYLNLSKIDLKEHELEKLTAFRINGREIKEILKDSLEEASISDSEIAFGSLLRRYVERERASMEILEAASPHSMALPENDAEFEWHNSLLPAEDLMVL